MALVTQPPAPSPRRANKVAFTYRTGEPPQDLLDLGRLPVPCDTTDPEQVEIAFKRIGEERGVVEVPIANAGATRAHLILRMPEGDFTSLLDTNLTSAFRLTKRAARAARSELDTGGREKGCHRGGVDH